MSQSSKEPEKKQSIDKVSRNIMVRKVKYSIIKGILWFLASILILLVVMVFALFIYFNTQSGKEFLSDKIDVWTDHSINVKGIHGNFPNHLIVEEITLKKLPSTDKPWLILKKVKLDWSFFELLYKKLFIQSLLAEEIDIEDLPKSVQSPDASYSTSSDLSFLWLSALINHLQINKLHLAQTIFSKTLDLKVNGKLSTSNLLFFLDEFKLNALPDTNLELDGEELNKSTNLSLKLTVKNHQVSKGQLTFLAKSNPDGILERLLKSDQLTPLSFNLSLDGPFDSLNTKMELKSNRTYLRENGHIDLNHSKMNVDLSGHSPAVTLNPQIHWDGWDLDARLTGLLTKPIGQGKFKLVNLAAGKTFLNNLIVSFSGEQNDDLQAINSRQIDRAHIHLVAEGLRVPGKHPMMFAKVPIIADAVYGINEPEQSIDFRVQHDLVKAVGHIFFHPVLKGSIDLALPHLSDIAKFTGVRLGGQSVFNLAFKMPEHADNPILFDLDGPIQVNQGLPEIVNMVGSKGHLGIHARIFHKEKPDIYLDNLTISGQNLSIQGNGHLLDQQVRAVVNLNIDNLMALSPLLTGQGKAVLKADGSLEDLGLRFEMATKFQTSSKRDYAIAPSDLKMKAELNHLFALPTLLVSLNGNLDRSPIEMELLASQKKNTDNYYFNLRKLNWRSLNGLADFSISGKNIIPNGNLDIKITRLADFKKLVRQNIEGNLALQIHSSPHTNQKLFVNASSKVNMPNYRFNNLLLTGYIDHPLDKPLINLKAQISDFQLPQAKGNIRLSANGFIDNLKVVANADFPSLMQNKGAFDTALLLDLKKKNVFLQKLNVLAKGENIHLTAPAKVDFGEKVAIDHFRLTLAPPNAPLAIIDLAGVIMPALNLNASIQNVTPAILKPFLPQLQANGTLDAQARLKGTLEKPTGSIQIKAANIKMLTGEAASLPVAQMISRTNLMGKNAQTHTHLQMGKKFDLSMNGLIPLNSNGKMDLNLEGKIDLGLGNAIAGAYGQQVKGNINLAMQIAGSFMEPIVNGTVQLFKGSFRDYAQGTSIQDIQAKLVGKKDHITLESLTAKAGHGDIYANGQIGVFQPGIPVSLHMNMKNARPLVSDLLTAILDGDIDVSGMAKSKIDMKGTIRIKHAEINIPHSISSSVVPLKVIRPGDKIETESRPNLPGPIIGLDLTIKSAGQILVQGFGLFTDMAGALHITGTADAPSVTGGMKMQNGHIDLSGISLDFTRGVIGFQGSNVDRKIDPSLDFEVKKTVEGNTARLLITGFASSPKITLTSSPSLSQDRVLAILLFGVDSQSLSATQMAEIGLALATLGGQSAGIDPLGTVRKSLGLDRLSLGGGSRSNENGGSNNGASVAAGKYVAKGVYIGAKQSTGNAGTQAEMQIDITKHLKATAAVGTGKDNSRFVTPDNDPGSNVGLLYEFDY